MLKGKISIKVRRPARKASSNKSDGRAALVFLAPWIAGLAAFTLGPLLFSLYLSFTSYNLFSAPRWIGLGNYIQLFHDPTFASSLQVTGTYVIISVPVVLICALGVALPLSKSSKGIGFYRTGFYLPTLVGGSVAIALVWTEVFSSTGVVNRVLAVFGIQGPAWLGDPSTALYTLIVLNVWTFGSVMVIFVAGLRQIPAELYEAAVVDGASRFRRFQHVTFPILSPVIFFNGLLTLIASFQTFTPAYIISDGTGGPIHATLLYSLYLYQEGFVNFKMGYAAALAWFMVAVLGVLTALVFATAKFWVFYGD